MLKYFQHDISLHNIPNLPDTKAKFQRPAGFSGYVEW